MEIDLTRVGIEKGCQYETIITSYDDSNNINAAPIGVICTGKNTILNRIFKGSKTLDNILLNKEFIVNVTHDPELFTLSTIGNLNHNYFSECGSIKNIEAYFKCEVISFKQARKQSDPIKTNGEAIVIKSKVVDIVVNENIKAMNRSMGCIIEALANLTRLDLVDGKEEYVEKFKELKRIVVKVGSKKDKESMKIIEKEMKKKVI